MKEKGHMNTKLEDIPTELGLTFGMWIKEKKKKANFFGSQLLNIKKLT